MTTQISRRGTHVQDHDIKPSLPRPSVSGATKLNSPSRQTEDQLIVYNPTLRSFATQLSLESVDHLRSIIVINETPVADWFGVFQTLAQNATGLEVLVISGITFVVNITSAMKLLISLNSFLLKPMIRETLTTLSLDVRLVDSCLPDLTYALAQSRIKQLRLVISIQDEFYLSNFGLDVIGSIASRILELEELVLDQVETRRHVPLLEDAFEDWIRVIQACPRLQILTMPAIFIDRSIGILGEPQEDETYLDREEVITVLDDWATEIMEGVVGQYEFREFRFLFYEEQRIRVLRIRQYMEVIEQLGERDNCLFWLPKDTGI